MKLISKDFRDDLKLDNVKPKLFKVIWSYVNRSGIVLPEVIWSKWAVTQEVNPKFHEVT